MPCVYALIDPRDGQLRYVGKTVGDVGVSLSSHLTPSRLKRNLHRAKWMASVVRDGVKPEVEVLKFLRAAQPLEEV